MGLRQLDYLQVPFMGNTQSQKKIFPAETSKPAENKRGGEETGYGHQSTNLSGPIPGCTHIQLLAE